MLPQASTLVQLLSARGLTCASAESCTGGGVGSAITAVPGSSEVFLGGIISYANEVKANVLKVSRDTLETEGAVSASCAEQMALGARDLTKADLAVSITGIAGPGGATRDKPVGLVYFAIATKNGVRSEKKIFMGDRESVRSQSVIHAIGMLTTAAL